MTEEKFLPLPSYPRYAESVMLKRATDFYEEMYSRRTIRDFSAASVDCRIIENCLRAAGRAPSGANQQPWKFVVVSDTTTKRKIREAAEEVELSFYNKEATGKWRMLLSISRQAPEKSFLIQRLISLPFLLKITVHPPMVKRRNINMLKNPLV